MPTRAKTKDESPALAVANVSRRPQQGRSKASLERMLAAARELMLERGSEEFTLQEVSERGQVSIGSIYLRFESKDNLVRGVIAEDAAALQGGDVIVRSGGEFTAALREELARVVGEGLATATTAWEFHSVARREGGEAVLFSNIKAVSGGYPLYGTVELRSGRPFAEVLRPGVVVVGQALLDRLGLAVGDRLTLISPTGSFSSSAWPS